jgi:hypothetical protein
MAGGTPANPATLDKGYKRTRPWLPHSYRISVGQGRRSLSGMSMGFIQDWFLQATLGAGEKKSWPGGPRPTLPRCIFL